jgi:cellulose synthase/poly-beta-1,6-N-acetylglucosamine synthase-like glycosyltransferase
VKRAAKLAFWASAGLLVYAPLGYPALLAALDRLRRPRDPDILPYGETDLPDVSLVVAAYNEAPVIAAKVENALALDYPRERLELIVSVDGATDGTAERARAAGADLVLENPREGKVRAQDAAVARARGEIVAFSDANATWEPGALRALVAPFRDRGVGYVCGTVRFKDADGATNQEGLYWRYEMWIRALESRLASVTAGNGAIYATRKDAYIVVDPVMGHDLSFPFNLVKRGWRAVYAPAARATEKMVPTVEGEFRRKRRMMSHTWPIVLRGGMLSPRGYGVLYGLMIASHRLLRYASPFVHLVALASNAALFSERAAYRVAFAAQAGLVAAAAAPVRARPFLVARYYVLTNVSVAAGLVDWLRHGTPAGWEAAEGTR